MDLSFLGTRELGKCSSESKVSSWQLAWGEQKERSLIPSLGNGNSIAQELPFFTLGIFLCKEQDDSLIIRTPALWVVREKNCKFFLCSSVLFSRLPRDLFALIIMSFSLILDCIIDCCLLPNDVKGGTSMTPLK